MNTPENIAISIIYLKTGGSIYKTRAGASVYNKEGQLKYYLTPEEFEQLAQEVELQTPLEDRHTFLNS